MENSSMDPFYKDHLSKLINTAHHDPHSFLGLHDFSNTEKVIRLWRPGAQNLFLQVQGAKVAAKKIDDVGLFEITVPFITKSNDYLVFAQNGSQNYDPYSFSLSTGEMDLYLFGKGVHYQLYEIMGARLIEHEGVVGTRFVVWAPAVTRVSVVGDFNSWDGRMHPMRSLGTTGLWELFIPGMKEGARYKFEIKTAQEEIFLKADPFAYSSELRPGTASIVANVDKYAWKDNLWMDYRPCKKLYSLPMNIYEVHLGSWKKNEIGFINYRELAHTLAAYCLELKFTHVELLPIAEHPLDESWGYQVSGFYSVTSRYGSPEDFQYFVDFMHRNEIGVILDWVPGHFPTDAFSLARFNGTALYEHENPKQGFHPDWNTYIFNFGRIEVSNFLLANALFWCDKMHIDGIRVDAVASILYLDYGRKEGEWIPNKNGGRENLEALEFFKHLNSVIHRRFPSVLTIAEESSAYPGVTKPVEDGGLGFDMKWNMGWMNDTLKYFSRDPIIRSQYQQELTFGLLYAFNENFVLPLSHDEVVHGKRSLLNKMPGDLWQRFANLRLLLSYLICQPGKKLLFMGGEIGQKDEWNIAKEVDWESLNHPLHNHLHVMIKELNAFYNSHSPLWEWDFYSLGFEWVDFTDSQNCVICYLRKGEGGVLLCVHNFTPQYIEKYSIPLKNAKRVLEVFNTDAERYGGSGKLNRVVGLLSESIPSKEIKIQLAPLSTMIFQVHFNT
jgi:1,4-alpha-glucan branching enzyme